ncbi:F-box family protein-like [Zostera marina]|uniref:F-box family protein-like n=1 Tax=Zostera marina TaxID=29655 RepID=A0A0K9PJ80_ZOSMR|nr:F-box family protein-like [Zostera marina]
MVMPSAFSSRSDLIISIKTPSNASDLGTSSSVWSEDGALMTDLFDRLPDSILLVVFNKIGDVKALGRCCVVSRRFHSLVLQVDNVVVRVDCVISDSDSHSPSASSSSSTRIPSNKGRGVLGQLAHLVLGGIVRPLQVLSQILAPRNSSNATTDLSCSSSSEVSHHSPTQVLKNFKEIRRLRIDLPSGELGVEDGVLLKWTADFGSTLHSCVILGASTIMSSSAVATPSASTISVKNNLTEDIDGLSGDDSSNNDSIPETFYTNGSLKLRVVWTISSLIAASARHYLLQPIIADHDTLEKLDLTDADGQGVLRMNKEQLGELRVKPVSASGSSHRTLVPALNMRLWYAPHLELPGGVVLKGATLVAIQPSDNTSSLDEECISRAFEEPYGTAARILLKRRTYCLEMNSF